MHICVITCSWGDADKACGHALHRADDRWLAEDEDIEGCPHEETGGSAHMSVEHSQWGVNVRGETTTTIEACPAQPK